MTRRLGFLIILPIIALTPAYAFESLRADSQTFIETSADTCSIEKSDAAASDEDACYSLSAARVLMPATSRSGNHSQRGDAMPNAAEVDALDLDSFVVSAGVPEGTSFFDTLRDFGSPALSLLALTFISIAAFSRRSVDAPMAGKDS